MNPLDLIQRQFLMHAIVAAWCAWIDGRRCGAHQTKRNEYRQDLGGSLSMGRPEIIAPAASHEAVLSASLPKIADSQQMTGYVAIADFEEVTLRQTEFDP